MLVPFTSLLGFLPSMRFQQSLRFNLSASTCFLQYILLVLSILVRSDENVQYQDRVHQRDSEVWTVSKDKDLGGLDMYGRKMTGIFETEAEDGTAIKQETGRAKNGKTGHDSG